jgi:N-acetylglucosaminyldiphosphoundecaprenol N-acetyl-beta-D-mannosaminyltransferase
MMEPGAAAHRAGFEYSQSAGEALASRDRHSTANVLGVLVDSLDLDRALARIADWLRRGQKGYVCAIDVHGVLEARRNQDVARAFAEAAMVAPDGTPIVWVGRLEGRRDIRAVTGPELMGEIFSRPEFAACSHFFYGGKPGVAEELAATWVRKFPSTRIAGTFTPPFRDLTADEEMKLIGLLRQCQPDIIWVGIGAPRQDLLMHRMVGRLDRGVMLGVGAAFDFHTGRIRNCAPWIKRLGFHWLHRLLQDPRRLWRRNLSNTAFLWHIALQLAGWKKYEAPPAAAGSPAGK